MENLLSIYEFSKLSDVESSTLRYWDEIGLFSPVKRDPENNYRYYSPEQTIAVNFIKVLSSIGIPLKTIREMENNRTPENIVRLIEHQERQLDMEIRRLRQCYSIIHTRRDMINFGKSTVDNSRIINDGKVSSADLTKGIKVEPGKVFVIRIDDINISVGPRNKFDQEESFYEPFADFCRAAKERRIDLSLPIGGLHDSWDRYAQAPAEPDYFFSVDPAGNDKIPAREYLIGFARGYYGQFGDLPEKMSRYIEENSLVTSGPTYALYLHDEVCVKDPSQYLVEVLVAVSKA